MKTTLFVVIFLTLLSSQAFSESTPLSDLKNKIESLESKVTEIETNQKSMMESQNKILEEIQILKVRAHRG